LIILLKAYGSQVTGAGNVDTIIWKKADRRKWLVEVEKTREQAKGNAALPLTETRT
jgi:hypothetical protein